MGEHDVKIRITGRFHEQIDIQVVGRRVKIASLTPSGDLATSVHAAHCFVLHLDPGLASESFNEWLKRARQAAGAINDQLLRRSWDAVRCLSDHSWRCG